MSGVSWLGFGIASTVTKSFMHFLPAAAGIGAPYPVDLRVTVGGVTLPRRTFSIEGARLGHPDGFHLEEAVPALNQHGSGMYLLQVDLLPAQQRVDLANSCILIELQYQQAVVRYLPRRIISDSVQGESGRSRSRSVEALNGKGTLGSIMSRGVFNAEAENSVGFFLRDPSLYASVVVLNSSSTPILAKFYSSKYGEEVGRVMVAPDSVKEFESSEIGLQHPSKLDSTWGSLEVEAFTVSFDYQNSEPQQSDAEKPAEAQSSQGGAEEHDRPAKRAGQIILGAAAAAYVVYRDRSSRRIASVVAL